jgi:hypothetical protein
MRKKMEVVFDSKYDDTEEVRSLENCTEGS